ncbi:hypothetical protein, partial [Salmonella enterica]|uniref:hypothetical protein n=1 Tax=Salmonella enterica TaxID=28901 RepID=UPI00398C54E8
GGVRVCFLGGGVLFGVGVCAAGGFGRVLFSFTIFFVVVFCVVFCCFVVLVLGGVWVGVFALSLR